MPIVPVSSVVKEVFCTVFLIIVVVWFPIAPFLKLKLGHRFWEIDMFKAGLRITVSEVFGDNNEVLHTGDPSLHAKAPLAPSLRPIQAPLEERDLYDSTKHQY